MQLGEYQDCCKRTMSDIKPVSIDGQWAHAIFGLQSEVGEIASEVQHALQEGRDINLYAVLEELGDAMWFMAEIAESMGVTLEEVAKHNIAKLKVRYPDGFNSWRSEHRHEIENGDAE